MIRSSLLHRFVPATLSCITLHIRTMSNDDSNSTPIPEKRASDTELKSCSVKMAKNDDVDQQNVSIPKLYQADSVELLRNDLSSRMAALHGNLRGEDFVCLLEKCPFTEQEAADIVKAEDVRSNLLFKNDVFHTFLSEIPKDLNKIKTTVVYPATKQWIDRFSEQNIQMVEETALEYEKVVGPFIDENLLSNHQWVYNILEHKAETQRITFEDPDPESGFIILPDLKWDQKQVDNLYCLALPVKHGIRSMRDLRAEHLPLLENILDNGCTAVEKTFGVPRKMLRIYFHYQPTFYHLHAHFTHVKLDRPGQQCEKAHLIQEVIQNIRLKSDYYRDIVMTCCFKERDPLFCALNEFRQTLSSA